MHLIIGGAYQGKLEYAKQQFGIAPDEICECNEKGKPDFSKRCLNHYERYLKFCLKQNITPFTDFTKESVIICQDIFCGIVPADREERAWRELAGRTVTVLARQAQSVTRIFCALPTKLK